MDFTLSSLGGLRAGGSSLVKSKLLTKSMIGKIFVKPVTLHQTLTGKILGTNVEKKKQSEIGNIFTKVVFPSKAILGKILTRNGSPTIPALGVINLVLDGVYAINCDENGNGLNLVLISAPAPKMNVLYTFTPPANHYVDSFVICGPYVWAMVASDISVGIDNYEYNYYKKVYQLSLANLAVVNTYDIYDDLYNILSQTLTNTTLASTQIEAHQNMTKLLSVNQNGDDFILYVQAVSNLIASDSTSQLLYQNILKYTHSGTSLTLNGNWCYGEDSTSSNASVITKDSIDPVYYNNCVYIACNSIGSDGLVNSDYTPWSLYSNGIFKYDMTDLGANVDIPDAADNKTLFYDSLVKTSCFEAIDGNIWLFDSTNCLNIVSTFNGDVIYTVHNDIFNVKDNVVNKIAWNPSDREVYFTTSGIIDGVDDHFIIVFDSLTYQIKGQIRLWGYGSNNVFTKSITSPVSDRDYIYMEADITRENTNSCKANKYKIYKIDRTKILLESDQIANNTNVWAGF
jgi:hypothetical protein